MFEEGKTAEKKIGWLSAIIATLAVIATLGGLFLPDLYQDEAFFTAQFYGQDFATLILSVPALIATAALLQRFPASKVILAGVLFYFVYSYSFYGFVAAFNDFYLLHVAILSLAFFTLLFQLYELRPSEYDIVHTSKFWTRAGAVFLLAVSGMLTFLWMQEILSHMMIAGYRSDLPDGEPATIVFTLDLGFIIPIFVYSAINAWRQRHWGMLLMGFSLVTLTLVGFALMGMAAGLALAKLEGSLQLAIIWMVMSLLGLVLTFFYLRSLDLRHFPYLTHSGAETVEPSSKAKARPADEPVGS